MKRLNIYAKAGIREYWVVNLKAKILIVFRDPVNGDYRQRLEVQTGVIRAIAFPNVVIDVARLMN